MLAPTYEYDYISATPPPPFGGPPPLTQGRLLKLCACGALNKREEQAPFPTHNKKTTFAGGPFPFIYIITSGT